MNFAFFDICSIHRRTPGHAARIAFTGRKSDVNVPIARCHPTIAFCIVGGQFKSGVPGNPERIVCAHPSLTVCVSSRIAHIPARRSAAATAADCRMDSRILFSAGRAAQQLGLMGENVKLIYGLPLAVTGKSPFFDRKPKK